MIFKIFLYLLENRKILKLYGCFLFLFITDHISVPFPPKTQPLIQSRLTSWFCHFLESIDLKPLCFFERLFRLILKFILKIKLEIIICWNNFKELFSLDKKVGTTRFDPSIIVQNFCDFKIQVLIIEFIFFD